MLFEIKNDGGVAVSINPMDVFEVAVNEHGIGQKVVVTTVRDGIRNSIDILFNNHLEAYDGYKEIIEKLNSYMNGEVYL